MKATIAIILLLLLVGCSQPKCISESGFHTWGRWTNMWKSPNHAGIMRQTRECEDCGLTEAGFHQ